ncbi:hypothetical protein CRUP_035643 [Coryphaenoides rupestris]|nr:hypothetical protein CRUP_035643 [Coryphaenoides rupestris]
MSLAARGQHRATYEEPAGNPPGLVLYRGSTGQGPTADHMGRRAELHFLMTPKATTGGAAFCQRGTLKGAAMLDGHQQSAGRIVGSSDSLHGSFPLFSEKGPLAAGNASTSGSPEKGNRTHGPPLQSRAVSPSASGPPALRERLLLLLLQTASDGSRNHCMGFGCTGDVLLLLLPVVAVRRGAGGSRCLPVSPGVSVVGEIRESFSPP